MYIGGQATCSAQPWLAGITPPLFQTTPKGKKGMDLKLTLETFVRCLLQRTHHREARISLHRGRGRGPHARASGASRNQSLGEARLPRPLPSAGPPETPPENNFLRPSPSPHSQLPTRVVESRNWQWLRGIEPRFLEEGAGVAAPRPRRQAGTPRWRWPRAQSAARPAAPARPLRPTPGGSRGTLLWRPPPRLWRPAALIKGTVANTGSIASWPRRAPRAAPTPVNFARAAILETRGAELRKRDPPGLPPCDPTTRQCPVQSPQRGAWTRGALPRAAATPGRSASGPPLRRGSVPPAGTPGGSGLAAWVLGCEQLWSRGAVGAPATPRTQEGPWGTEGSARSRMGGDLRVGRGTRGDKAAKAKLTPHSALALLLTSLSPRDGAWFFGPRSVAHLHARRSGLPKNLSVPIEENG